MMFDYCVVLVVFAAGVTAAHNGNILAAVLWCLVLYFIWATLVLVRRIETRDKMIDDLFSEIYRLRQGAE